MTYSLKDIETISWTYKFNLSEDTIKLINQLTVVGILVLAFLISRDIIRKILVR